MSLAIPLALKGPKHDGFLTHWVQAAHRAHCNAGLLGHWPPSETINAQEQTFQKPFAKEALLWECQFSQLETTADRNARITPWRPWQSAMAMTFGGLSSQLHKRTVKRWEGLVLRLFAPQPHQLSMLTEEKVNNPPRLWICELSPNIPLNKIEQIKKMVEHDRLVEVRGVIHRCCTIWCCLACPESMI